MAEQTTKFDVKKDFASLYRPTSKGWASVEVPTLRFLAVDGHGDPNTSAAYAQAIESLYTVAYTLKFALKERGQDFVVPPLEGLWYAADPTSFVERRKDEWDWTMLIAVPPFATAEDVESAREKASAKKPKLPLSALALREISEGRSLQILHVGAYDDEGPSLRVLHEKVMPDGGVTFNGAHHEIYLSDPRRVAPEKLKTVLRQTVREI